MDMPLSQITYHSRRRDNQLIGPYTGNMKSKQRDHHQHINQFSYQNNSHNSHTPYNNLNNHNNSNQFSYQPSNNNNFSYSNISHKNTNDKAIIIQAPSFSHLQTSTQQRIISQKIQQNYQRQIDIQKQKVRTLTYHLKTAIQSNNDIQSKYSILKSKYQQIQVNHMNQVSILKSDLIILEKEYHKERNTHMNKQKQSQYLNEKLQSLKEMNNRLKEQIQLKEIKVKSLAQEVVDAKMKIQKQQRTKQQQIKEIKEKQNKLKQFSMEIQKSKNQMAFQYQNKLKLISLQLQKSKKQNNHFEKSIKQYQTIVSRQQSSIESLEILVQKSKFNQKQINNHNNSLTNQTIQLNKQIQSLTNQNNELSKQLSTLKHRISQLNQNIKHICQNSEHLFQQIKQKNIQIQILNKKLDQKDHQKYQTQTKLNQLLNQFETSFSQKYQQLKMRNQITEEQYRQITEKHYKLQQQNIEREKYKTDLIRENQVMESEIRELKQLCEIQQRKEQELQQIVITMEREIQMMRQSKQHIKQNQQQNNNYQPYQNIYNEEQNTAAQRLYDQTQHRRRNVSIRMKTQITQPKYTRIDDQQRLSNNQNLPYSQYLSFKPSLPHQSANNNYQSAVVKNRQRQRKRCYTSADDFQTGNQRNSMFNSINNHSRKNLPLKQKQKRSQSFYEERNNQNNSIINLNKSNHYLENKNPSDSVMAPRYSSSFLQQNSLRNSLDNFKRKSSLLNLNKREGTQFIDNYRSGSMFEEKESLLHKLDKMKLWAKPTVSQNCTQRQALQQIPLNSKNNNSEYLKDRNSHYLKNKQTSIPQIIQQKSKGLLNQRKNIYNLNISNQMIQKNMLKLKKNNQQTKNFYAENHYYPSQKDYSTTYIPQQNNLSNISPIGVDRTKNQKNKENSINQEVYRSCQKALYQN